MKKETFSLVLFMVLIGTCCFSGGYWGVQAAALLAQEPEPVVHERVVYLKPVVVEKTIYQSISQPLQITMENCVRAEQQDQADESTQPDEEQNIEAELPAPPAPVAVTPPAPLELKPAVTVAQDPPVYDALGIYSPAAGAARISGPGEYSSWWEPRKVMGAGLRNSLNFNDGGREYSATAYGYWEFLRLSDVYFTGYGEINNDLYKKVQLDMQWRMPH